MTGQWRQRVLAALLGLLLLVLGIRVVRPLLSGRSDGAVSRFGTGDGGDSASSFPAMVELDLGDLERKPGEFRPGRDPFRFWSPPVPAPPPPPPPAARPSGQKRPQQASRRAAQKPKPPPVSVTFLGSFGPAQRRIAVFTDGNDLYNVRVGDVVKVDFVLESIGYESADLKYVNFPEVPAQRLAAGG